MNTNILEKKATYSAEEIANFFIWKAHKENKQLTNKKLQKLLYYAQAWHLALEEKPLFKEGIEAWVHGPAVRKIYFKYRAFGFAYIEEQIDEDKISELKNIAILNEVWKVYGKFDADYLEALTHNEQPWLDAREGLSKDEASNNRISHESMRDFYQKKLKEAKK